MAASLVPVATQPRPPTVALAERKVFVVVATTTMITAVTLVVRNIVLALRLTLVAVETAASTTSFQLPVSVDAWRMTAVPRVVAAAEVVETDPLQETDEAPSHQSPFASETKG